MGKAWNAKNPGYIEPSTQAGYDLGIVVYVIRNYDGKGNDYVGCTQNFPLRMAKHKYGDKAMGVLPKLNTENAEVLHECSDDREKALKIEASYHDRGYHGGSVNQWDKVNNNYER